LSLTKIKFEAKKISQFIFDMEDTRLWQSLILDLDKNLFKLEALERMTKLCQYELLNKKPPSFQGSLWQWEKQIESFNKLLYKEIKDLEA
jgi:hypothetical protein